MGMQKGAMFGLDARIALAIFGALSVISGAALYSAIQQARDTAILSDLNEFAKSYESYYIDMGRDATFIDSLNLNSASLVDSSIDSSLNWKGPYIDYNAVKDGSSAINIVLERGDGHAIFSKARVSDWTAFSSAGVECTLVSDCAIYARFDRMKLDVAKRLDLKVDGVEGAMAGRFKYSGTDGFVYIHLLIKPTNDISKGVKIY